MKYNLALIIVIATLGLCIPLVSLAMPNSKDAMDNLINDPEDFLDKFHLNTQAIFKDKNLPYRGYVKLTSENLNGFQAEYSQTAADNTTPTFFLANTWPNNLSPSYIDVPKKAIIDGTLVLTPPLTGASIVVTDHNRHFYRVYRDSRTNIAVVYDNVVFAAEQANYHSEKPNSDIAGALLIYKNQQWQLILQPLQLINDPQQPLKTLLLKRNNLPDTMVQHLGDINDQLLLTQFTHIRKQLQSHIVMLTKEIGIDIQNIPTEHDYIDGTSMRVDESTALREWHELRELIKRKINDDLAPIIQQQGELFSQVEKAKEPEKTELYNQIDINEHTLEYYDSRYTKALGRSYLLDTTWLWLQKKVHEGIDNVLAPYNDPSIDPNRLLITKYLLESERLENLSGQHNMGFKYGMQHFKKIPIPGTEKSMTFTELMALFFNNDHILTNEQKGALFRHTEESYQSFVVNYVLNETQRVKQYMQNQGAKQIKLAPQDMILLGKIGNCVGLSRSMAVAIAQQGDNGINKFTATLFKTMANPKSISSINVYNSLKQLHLHPLADRASINKGIIAIKDIVSMLKRASVNNGSIMLTINTQNHAMLAGKTNINNEVSYYFYDPNFGVFKFTSHKALKKALRQHFIKNKYAEKYESFGTTSKPLFDIDLLNPSQLGNINLSTGLSIETMIDPQDSPRQQLSQATAHEFADIADNLTRNADFKSNMNILRTINITNRAIDSIKNLYKANQLNMNWFPVFDSLQKIKKNHFTLHFIQSDRDKIKIVKFKDKSLWEFKNHLDEKFESIKKIYDFKNNKPLIDNHIGDIESINGLSAAITIQTVMNFFKNHYNKKQNESINSKLSTAMEIHSYINLTQVIHDDINQLNKIFKIYRAVFNGGIIQTTMTLSKIPHIINQGASIIYGPAAIVLDSYELAHAQNEQQKAVFATQLSFDSTSFSIGLAELGTGLIGATTASAILGFSGDIFAGLSIGFIGLAQTLGEVADDAKAVGRYFAIINNAYKLGGYQTAHKKLKDGTKYNFYSPLDGAVITHLDLTNNQITFDSQYLYRSHHGKTGSGDSNYFFWAGDFPQMQTNKSQAINIRIALNYPANSKISPKDQMIVLPITPKSYIGYTYQILPGATTLQASGFDVLRKLEKARTFDYDFYSFPSEYIVRKITQEYIDTKITVDLPTHKQTLIMRKLSSAFQNKLHYDLAGNGSLYHIHLQTGAQLTLRNQTQSSTWILDARSLTHKAHSLTGKVLKIGTVTINISSLAQDKIIIINQYNELLSVDLNTKKFIPLSEDASQWQSLTQLSQHLDATIDSQHLNSKFIQINNFIPQGKTQPVGTAYYQTNKKRFVYTPLAAQGAFLNQAKLIAIKDNDAYFHAANELWRVDLKRQKVVSQYRLFDWLHTQTQPIKTHAWVEGQNLFFAVTQQMDNGLNAKWTYRVKKNKLALISINGDTQLIAALNSDDARNETDTRAFFKITDHYLNGKTDLQPQKWVNASLAHIISISATVNGKKHRFWVFSKQTGDTGVLKANINKKNVDDLILVHTDGKQQSHYFYSANKKQLYIQQGTHSQSKLIKIPQKNSKIEKVFLNNNKLFAITTDNNIWLINQKAWLFGVTPNWLKKNHTQVLNKITTLTQSQSNKVAQLSILGLTNDNNDKVNFWLDTQTMLLIITGKNLNNKTISLLGVTSDKKSAWLFNKQDNSLYKQSIITGDVSINDKLKLISPINEAQKITLLSGNIAKANLIGQQIQLITINGLVLTIDKDVDPANINKPLLIAIRPQWQKKNNNLSESINKLNDKYRISKEIKLIGHKYPTWYLFESKRIFTAKMQKNEEKVKYIGEAVDGGDYVYNQTTNKLYRYHKDSAKMIGIFKQLYINNGKNLIIKTDRSQSMTSIPKIKSINNLFWSNSKSKYNFKLTNNTLKHYNYIVIQSYKYRNNLVLSVKNEDNLIMQSNYNNFILYDKDTKSKIIITNSKLTSNNKFKITVNDNWVILYSLLYKIKHESKIKGQLFYFKDKNKSTNR
ncbi:TcdA/TcdB pore-forming domain-containing protein [Shewanella marina]|uniref:TcdA/TcdB pore-forming domain-containing protein n=1 Tax=Shewanella marina TaxID=487319 RepID=UPI00047218FD|nr:TcdA/TcdB pore-forming domain-containing protein [Shewanella marina]